MTESLRDTMEKLSFQAKNARTEIGLYAIDNRSGQMVAVNTHENMATIALARNPDNVEELELGELVNNRLRLPVEEPTPGPWDEGVVADHLDRMLRFERQKGNRRNQEMAEMGLHLQEAAKISGRRAMTVILKSGRCAQLSVQPGSQGMAEIEGLCDHGTVIEVPISRLDKQKSIRTYREKEMRRKK